MKEGILIGFLVAFASLVFAQQEDFNRLYTLEEYLTQVRNYHPVMQQSALLNDQANASIRKARGNFDPKLYAEYDDKDFVGKNYYKKGEGGLKIPLWFGADVKAAYTWANGQFLNLENTLPAVGQAVAGVEIPLLRGMFFDDRRAAVQQAELFQTANENEQRLMINELILQASISYWNWAYQYQVLQVYENSLELSRARFELIRESFIQGDKPAIDTLEAMIQNQNREIQRNQALTDFQNAGLALSDFLWGEDRVPLQIAASVRPENPNVPVETDFWKGQDFTPERLTASHPDLQKILIKQQSLQIKERLKREQLKPKFNVEFNFLSEGANFIPGSPEEQAFTQLFTENYKWGIDFEYPIFLRKARGDVQLVQLEQTQNILKLDQKRLELQNKIGAIIQEADNINTQLNILENNLNNYQLLLAAENEKFRIGESSVFLLNSREQKLIDAQLKLIKTETELQKLRFKKDWALGILR